MPRPSNRSQRGAHSNRTHARRDQAAERTNPPVSPAIHGSPHTTGHRTLSDFGQPPRRIREQLNRAEAASAESGSHPPGAAPLGVGGGGASPESGRRPVREPREKPRTGDTVPSANGRYSVTLTGGRLSRSFRCTGKLSEVDARKIVRSLATQGRTSGRKVLLRAAGSTTQVVPSNNRDRGRAVLRWTNHVLKRPVGIRWVRKSLKEFGLWSRVEQAAKRHDRREKRKLSKGR